MKTYKTTTRLTNLWTKKMVAGTVAASILGSVDFSPQQ
jgi:hypothetical protein